MNNSWVYSMEDRVKYGKYVKLIDYKDYETNILYDEESDKYFSDIDEMAWHYENIEEKEMPKYAYGCCFEPVKIDYEWVIDSVCEDHAECVEDCLKGVEGLIEAIEQFNKANKDVGSYYMDLKTIINLENY